MEDIPLNRLFNRARVDDRQVNEVIGMAHGIIADGQVNQQEIEYLFKWLVANLEVGQNPVVILLFQRIKAALSDGQFDAEESRELLELLTRFAGGNFEMGETLKASTLPLCDPQPQIEFEGSRFCFTGTFAFGSRRDCEAAVADRGGTVGAVSKQTRYLVIGAYATESWMHSSFGRKIEQAVEFRSKGLPISIVEENHWVKQMKP
jgi:NAD-dependent DNA ligase